MPGFLDALRQITDKITPTTTPTPATTATATQSPPPRTATAMPFPSFTPSPTRTPRPTASPTPIPLLTGGTRTYDTLGEPTPIPLEGWSNLTPEIATLLERTQIRQTLEELARHTLNNFDQVDTIPVGELFTKIPLGSGYYSRLIDAFQHNTDVSPEDHQRTVEAFGASALTPDIQTQIMISLLKSFLAESPPTDNSAPMITPTPPPYMASGPQLPQPFDFQTVPGLVMPGAPTQVGSTPAPPTPSPMIAPPSPYYSGNAGATTPSLGTSSVSLQPTQAGTEETAMALGGPMPVYPVKQEQQGFRPTSLQLIAAKDGQGIIGLYSPTTNHKLGYYDENQKAIYTGSTQLDLDEAKASGAFPTEQLQRVTENYNDVLDKATKASTDLIRANAEAESHRAQAAYATANATKTATEARLLEIKSEQDRQEFEVRLEALKLANELAPLTKQAKTLELSRAELDLQQAQQSYPLDLQYKQEQLAMAQAQRQQLDQERARKSNMDTFAANFFPSLIHAIAPSDQPPTIYNRLAQNAGVSPDDPAAQAALTVLQNNFQAPNEGQ